MKNFLLSVIALALISTSVKAQVTVTYKVNIADYLAAGNTLGANGIRIGGNFAAKGATSSTGATVPDWTPSAPPCAMTDMGGNVWSIAITYPASAVGSTQLYKFVNNDWGTNEGTDPANTIVAGGCGVNDGGGNINRTFTIPATNAEICYTWDACSPCGAAPVLPVVVTDSVVTNIETTSATVKAIISGSGIQTRGFFFGTNPNPDEFDSNVELGQGPGSISFNLPGLTPNTLYYVRAYATNPAGIAYGNQITFRTYSITDFAVVSTAAATNVTSSGAQCGGDVTFGGSTPVTARGVCWSLSRNPTVSLMTKTVDGSGTGAFTSNITGLGSGLKFFFRAYATNAAGTRYGALDSLTTPGTPITNIQVTYKVDITNYLANGNTLGSGKMRVGGNFAAYAAQRGDSLMKDWTPSNIHSRMDSLGNNIWAITVTYPVSAGGSVQEYKFVNNDWGTNEGTNAEHTIDIGGCGMPWGNRSLLIPFSNQEVCYFWDACVSCGTVLALPNVTATTQSGQVTDTTAAMSGTAEGEAIGNRGFCYGTLPSPTLGDQVAGAGKGAGSFSATLIGLAPLTTYYVRSFAKNLAGVAYGPEVTFTTSGTTSVSGTFQKMFVQVVPNPSGSKVRFAGLRQAGTLVLKTIQGIEVLRREVTGDAQVDISNLPSSAYFYSIETKDGVVRGKLIRE